MVLGDLSVRSYFGVALPRALVHAQGHNRHNHNADRSSDEGHLANTET